MSEHCWHKTQLAGTGFVKSYDGEICCHCGETWSEHIKVPSQGHGQFDPDPRIKNKTKECKVPHPLTQH